MAIYPNGEDLRCRNIYTKYITITTRLTPLIAKTQTLQSDMRSRYHATFSPHPSYHVEGQELDPALSLAAVDAPLFFP